jgi:hypothetical protein
LIEICPVDALAERMPDMRGALQANETQADCCFCFSTFPPFVTHRRNDVALAYDSVVDVLLRVIGVLTTDIVRCAKDHQPGGESGRPDFTE